ncbi:acyltransferase-like protein At3g26840, chloroplastic isoform X2 [Durio zibethinus]|uniref:Acyltransferase-like protein At3g26840, chloroplastic isoform X2 n=1 Tax=Durio zibethinus TaxID=66656 RepID=A0A6P5ZDL5_DURZI|nr:acyltransferase-like protein At3g26840, chloroplastic isoform X2 [Durio zibethinus]
MAATRASLFLAGSSLRLAAGKSGRNRHVNLSRRMAASAERISAAETVTTSLIEKGKLLEEKKKKKKKKGRKEESELISNVYSNLEEIKEESRKTLKDYFQECKDLIIRSNDGPPRWFSPLECCSHSRDSPLLLFLPGIDGTGLGLITHHHKLGKIFEMWCLHIPVKDTTSFTDLVKLVERTVRSEYTRSPLRPIYLVGESLGACIALDVAARNPDVDLVLILVNPATSFGGSRLQSLIPLLELMPDQLFLSLPEMLNLVSGDLLRMGWENVVKGLLPLQPFGELSQDLTAMSSYLSVLADMLPRETLLWKLQMLKSASASANSHLHAVKVQALVLCSGKDQLFPSQKEAQRLRHMLPKCHIRMFEESGHFLFLEDNVDLVTIIKATSFYRRGKYLDYVSDYMPPTPYEFKKIQESNRVYLLSALLINMPLVDRLCSHWQFLILADSVSFRNTLFLIISSLNIVVPRWVLAVTSPVMFSTLEDGKVVRGLAGIPLQGPVLYVGYHMLLGFELAPMVIQFLMERKILLRGIAHPMMFIKLREGKMPDLAAFDTFRLMGAVPVSGPNFYKLLSSKSHVLLYPGGVREALHRKGEEYKLFWPEQSEFVRMASKFGAKIVPFGVVGEDDVGELVFDYGDQMRIPPLRSFIKELTEEVVQLRTDANGEVSNQDIHLPGVLPKLPGRFYYYFGKPIETEGRKQELRDREKCHELYLHVKSEVERCMAYLKEEREKDPYRNLLPRLLYQATNGFTAEVPTFEL